MHFPGARRADQPPAVGRPRHRPHCVMVATGTILAAGREGGADLRPGDRVPQLEARDGDFVPGGREVLLLLYRIF